MKRERHINKDVTPLSYSSYIINSFIQHWELPAMTDYPGVPLNYRDVAEQIVRLHVLMEDLQLNSGDKVAICGRNCSNWAITFLAITTFGTVAVPLLHEFTSLVSNKNWTS